MSHTPPPWEYREAGTFLHGEPGSEQAFEVPCHVVSIITDDHGRKITRFVAECSSTTLHNDDNARLIAAAPELLEQLKSVLSCIEAVGETLGNMGQMRAAIAKAEGK